MKKSLILSVAAAALSFPVFGGDFSWNGFRYDAETGFQCFFFGR